MQKVLIQTLTTYEYIHTNEIDFIESDNGISIVNFNGRKIKSLDPLSKVLDICGNSLLFRCHNSYVVNIGKVKSVHKSGTVELESGDTIPISRRRFQDFLDVLLDN